MVMPNSNIFIGANGKYNGELTSSSNKTLNNLLATSIHPEELLQQLQNSGANSYIYIL
jgi:hypothetical protein